MSRDASTVGVGLLFNPVVPAVLDACPADLDHLAVIPEALWVDDGPGSPRRFAEITQTALSIAPLLDRLPVVAHGISLSIGSAMPLDDEHLHQMAAWCDQHAVPWYSEHLGFFAVADAASRVGRRHTGLGLPLACDRETLDLLVPRIRRIRRITGRPFLLENGVNYTPIVDQEMSEPALLNRLATHAGSEVLLDLHNLYVESVNHGLDLDDYVGELDLGLVREIHVAGGMRLAGMYTDSHSGLVPDAVRQLLAAVAPRCANLAAVTFEFHESSVLAVGLAPLAEEIDRLRAVLRAAGVRVTEAIRVAC